MALTLSLGQGWGVMGTLPYLRGWGWSLPETSGPLFGGPQSRCRCAVSPGEHGPHPGVGSSWA